MWFYDQKAVKYIYGSWYGRVHEFKVYWVFSRNIIYFWKKASIVLFFTRGPFRRVSGFKNVILRLVARSTKREFKLFYSRVPAKCHWFVADFTLQLQSVQ